jgi:L-glutamine-phosphate cytidylyltransferase
MKVIILAAGMGTRLGKYTEDLPKAMVNIFNKPLIESQIEILHSAGLTDISIVRGYAPDKFQLKEVKYYNNNAFATTNMVESLMAASPEIEQAEDGVLVCYGDIIFEKRLLETLINSNNEVSVLVDDDWQDYWQTRLSNWQNDIESLQYDDNDNIFELGNPNCSIEKANSRYIGLIKFSQEGCLKLLEIYDKNKEQYWESKEKWHHSKNFQNAYMTCLLQELIDNKIEVKAVHVKHGWLEFDTAEDVEKKDQLIKKGFYKPANT